MSHNAPAIGPKSWAFHSYWTDREKLPSQIPDYKNSYLDMGDRHLNSISSTSKADKYTLANVTESNTKNASTKGNIDQSLPSSRDDDNNNKANNKTANTSVTTKNSSSPQSPIELNRAELRYMKRSVLYCPLEIPAVPGVLTVSCSCIQFEPDPRFQTVKDKGLGFFQMYIDISDVVSCASLSMPNLADSDCSPGVGGGARYVFFLQLLLKTLDGQNHPAASRLSSKSGNKNQSPNSLPDNSPTSPSSTNMEDRNAKHNNLKKFALSSSAVQNDTSAKNANAVNSNLSNKNPRNSRSSASSSSPPQSPISSEIRNNIQIDPNLKPTTMNIRSPAVIKVTSPKNAGKNKRISVTSSPTSSPNDNSNSVIQNVANSKKYILPNESETSHSVIFQVETRDHLYSLTKLVLDLTDACKNSQSNNVLQFYSGPKRTLTNVPFCSVKSLEDLVNEFDNSTAAQIVAQEKFENEGKYQKIIKRTPSKTPSKGKNTKSKEVDNDKSGKNSDSKTGSNGKTKTEQSPYFIQRSQTAPGNYLSPSSSKNANNANNNPLFQKIDSSQLFVPPNGSGNTSNRRVEYIPPAGPSSGSGTKLPFEYGGSSNSNSRRLNNVQSGGSSSSNKNGNSSGTNHAAKKQTSKEKANTWISNVLSAFGYNENQKDGSSTDRSNNSSSSSKKNKNNNNYNTNNYNSSDPRYKDRKSGTQNGVRPPEFRMGFSESFAGANNNISLSTQQQQNQQIQMNQKFAPNPRSANNANNSSNSENDANNTGALNQIGQFFSGIASNLVAEFSDDEDKNEPTSSQASSIQLGRNSGHNRSKTPSKNSSKGTIRQPRDSDFHDDITRQARKNSRRDGDKNLSVPNTEYSNENSNQSTTQSLIAQYDAMVTAFNTPSFSNTANFDDANTLTAMKSSDSDSKIKDDDSDADLLMPRFDESQSKILSMQHAIALQEYLPISVRFSQWMLVYSPTVHGISLQTFYRNLENNGGPSFLVIRDSTGKVFGGFASEQWKMSSYYYGTGDAFVFSFEELQSDKNKKIEEDCDELQLTINPWTSQNNYIMFSDEKILAMGGGGKTALVVEADFLRGASQATNYHLIFEIKYNNTLIWLYKKMEL